jgi:hypothetical protein
MLIHAPLYLAWCSGPRRGRIINAWILTNHEYLLETIVEVYMPWLVVWVVALHEYVLPYPNWARCASVKTTPLNRHVQYEESVLFSPPRW